jgi:two-component system sensor kinase FixL
MERQGKSVKSSTFRLAVHESRKRTLNSGGSGTESELQLHPMLFGKFQGISRVILAAVLIAIIAAVDWRVEVNIAFGFLYIFPILLLGTVMSRWQILLTVFLCTFLADYLDPFPFTFRVALPQDILVFAALAGAGFFSYEVMRSRRQERENLKEVEKEVAARREAEEQLEFLIESSPAAIFTMSADYLILRGNSAAHRLLGVSAGALVGKSIRRYIPDLEHVPLIGEASHTFRTEMQCRGEREDGEGFLANVFFSTYNTTAGPRLAAFVVDASEELREREEMSLDQLMTGSRILVGAVSHEVRNVCGAISIIHENLARNGRLKENQDFEALGSLVQTLNKIASLELKQSASYSKIESIDLLETLDDLRIVLDLDCREAAISVHWDTPEKLPLVIADKHRLLQVLLNLVRNSERALQTAVVKKLDISVSAGDETVSIRVADNGPGIGSVEKLFQPFQRGADSTGLGLFLSRAFVRSFRGDLRHDPATPGCAFIIDLAIAGFHQKGGGLSDNGSNAAAIG